MFTELSPNPVALELAYEAEAQFLGAILLLSSKEGGGRAELQEANDILSTDDFWYEDHIFIFKAMVSTLQMTSKPIDEISIAHEIARTTNYKLSYCAELHLLIAHCYSPFDYLHFAREIKSLADQRRGIPEKPRYAGGV